MQFVTGKIAFVSDGDCLAARRERSGKFQVISLNRSIFDGPVIELLLHNAGDAGAILFEPEVCIARRSVRTRDFKRPRARDVGGEGSDAEKQGEERNFNDFPGG
jgi:hypothetical protein